MLVFAFTSIFAQEADTIKVVNVDSLVNSGQICFDPVLEDDSIYIYVKQMPEFPGGKLALYRWIREQFNYSVVPDGCGGTVFIRFEVNKQGKIGKIDLLKGVDPTVDKEAIRVIRSLPKFKPGMKDGKPVNVWWNSIPVKIFPD